MFGFGPMELMIIFLIVLILFGANKLPQLGDGMGRAIHNFKSSITTEELSDSKHARPEISDCARKPN